MTLSLYFSAPWIARFYDQPRLVSITRWSSLNLLLTGFSVVQFTLLQKEFLIRLRSIATVSSVIVAGIVSVFMAFKGYGVWSLVALGLVMNLVKIVVIWIIHPWRPAFIFSKASFRSLFGFGSRLLGSSLMIAIHENIYQLIIGKIYTATDLGFFQRAKRFMMLCAYTPITVITQIHFPYMCKIQNDRVLMALAFSKSFKYSVMATLPLLVGLGVAGSNIVTFLVGEKWLPCVPYLQVMCLTGIIYVGYMLNLDVIKALGRSDQLLKIEFFKRILLAISIVGLYRFGILALLYGEVFCSLVAASIVARVLHQHIKVGVLLQLKWLAPCLISAVLMGGAVYFVDFSLSHLWQTLMVQVGVGMLTYFGSLFVLRDREFIFAAGKLVGFLRAKLI